MESPSTPISDMRWLTLRVQRTIWADWSLHLSEAQNTPWGTCCWTECRLGSPAFRYDQALEGRQCQLSEKLVGQFEGITWVYQDYAYRCEESFSHDQPAYRCHAAENRPGAKSRGCAEARDSSNDVLRFSGVSPDYRYATYRLDKFKNDGNYDALLTEAKEYDQGDAPDLSKINLSPTKYRGDDLLVEDEHYAVVYNPTVGGTYDVMRKVSAEEIKDNIIRYGLPEDATDDVKEVARQMEKEEVVAQEEEQHYHWGR